MPRKTNTKSKVEKVEKVEKVVKSVDVEKPVKVVRQKKVTKETKPVVETVDVSDVESGDSPVEKKTRSITTKESVLVEFTDLVSVIDSEITRLRETQGKTKGVKFLRSLGKKLKILQGHTARVMKQKQKTNRKNNTNSGFLKPVQLSKEMTNFTGWDAGELRSRVDVTKYICNYIKEHDLQNPVDRRQILVDKKLGKLLEYDSKKADKPLTYYRIQTYIKKHFTNPPKVV